MSAISAVLFDVNDVLYDYDKAARVASLARQSGKDPSLIEAAIWGSGYEDLGDTGALDADGYLRGFGERIGYPLTAEEWIRAVTAAVSPLPDALALAGELASSARIAVLTNNNLLVARHIDACFPALRPIFGDNIFVSAQFGARKPDPEVYRRCVERLGTREHATLFVDDSAANVAGAERAGLRGHLYRGAAALRRSLKECGLLRRSE